MKHETWVTLIRFILIIHYYIGCRPEMALKMIITTVMDKGWSIDKFGFGTIERRIGLNKAHLFFFHCEIENGISNAVGSSMEATLFQCRHHLDDQDWA